MKKFKEEKGITLVALIITIVVLLILAAVAIGTVRDSDIIGYAQNAAGGYNAEKIKEEGTLGNYVNTIEENIPKGEEEGISIDKILNKAYTAENGGNMMVYYITQEESKTYINFEAYDITTGEETSDEYEGGAQQFEISLASEFETVINIVVNGSPLEISNKNAFSIEGLNSHITLDGIYMNVQEGGTYTAPDSEKIFVRNSNYDSFIND